MRFLKSLYSFIRFTFFYLPKRISTYLKIKSISVCQNTKYIVRAISTNSAHNLNKRLEKLYTVVKPVSDHTLGFRLPLVKTTSKERIGCFGCSNTLGAYLPLEHTWPFLLNKKLDNKYQVDNLGVSGASNDMICRLVYDYITLFAPKAICCLFPDVYRKDYYTLSSSWNNTVVFYPAVSPKGEKLSKYKDEFNANLVLTSEENAFLNFVKNFLFIKEICNARKIHFYWHTWSELLFKADLKILKKYLGYDTQYIVNNNKLYNITFDELLIKKSDLASDGLHHGFKYNDILSSKFAYNINQSITRPRNHLV